jgi:hypothetical protein
MATPWPPQRLGPSVYDLAFLVKRRSTISSILADLPAACALILDKDSIFVELAPDVNLKVPLPLMVTWRRPSARPARGQWQDVAWNLEKRRGRG